MESSERSRQRTYGPAETSSSSPMEALPLLKVGSLEAIRRHRVLAVTPMILLVALAIAYGVTRPPTYTAESRLAVARIGLETPGALSGFATATAALAATYSRAADSTTVVRNVASRVGTSEDEVRSRLSGTPLPNSAVIRLRATGDSSRSAIDMANAGSAALQRYIVDLNRHNPNADRLYRAFRDASTVAARRHNELRRLRASVGPTPTPTQARRQAEAEADADAADLRAETYRSGYVQAQQSQSTISLLQPLATASSATSNFVARLELAVFIAIVVGGLLGVALAGARVNRRARSVAGSSTSPVQFPRAAD
jgi:uncharacterized protein involved in exopolysaccharide biosynthesis